MEGIVMTDLRRWKGCFFVWAFLSGLLLFGFTQMVRAEERGFSHREFRDSRYHHDRSYPARGQFVEVLPPGYRMVGFGRARYYFFDGVWYRPSGRRFLIVAPPIGLVVPFLPPYYSTIMVGGVPYYYANEVYYTQNPGGYVVVEPPKGEVNHSLPPAGPMPSGPLPPGPPPSSQAPSAQMPSAQMPSNQIFIYPRQGQSQEKQANDRNECHRWAVSQMGYDPTKPPTGMPEAQIIQMRADYQRAMGACLDARGYTMK